LLAVIIITLVFSLIPLYKHPHEKENRIFNKTILSEILDYNPAGLSLIARQKILNSGKIDLLYMYDDNLILLELKVIPFYPQIIGQIKDKAQQFFVKSICKDMEKIQKK